MLAYFVLTFYSYKDRVQVSYYEVEEGSLVKEHNYTGIILRDEQIFESQANGYIYYYVADGRKAAKGSPVYSIDEGGQLMNYLNTHSEELSELNSGKAADIRAEMLGYSRTFNPSNFRTLYNIKNSLDAHTIEYASMNIFNTISNDLAAAGISFREFNADMTGIVCCYTDGYEDLTEGDIQASVFARDTYEKNNIKAGDLVSTGMPVYKMITDENWEIVFPLNDEDIAEFGSSDVLKVSFSDKNFSVKTKFKIITGKDSRKYGVLPMSSYIVQFTPDRYVDFEIVTNDVSGLKIPVKAVTSKDFYVIPVEFLITDANGNKGFYKAVVGGTGTAAQFVMPEIFSIDEEYCYIDCPEGAALQPGDYVLAAPENASAVPVTAGPSETETAAASDNQEDAAGAGADAASDAESGEAAASSESSAAESSSGENSAESGNAGEAASSSGAGESSGATGANSPGAGASGGTSGSNMYQIAARMSLDGVYNVNKGYTIFKKVDILETANGYSIIKKNSAYGLQVYDHIVLDASTVHDGQILYR